MIGKNTYYFYNIGYLLFLVTTSLITNADPRDEDNGGSRVRTQALNMLCQMNPSQALAVRAKCVSKKSSYEK